MNKTPVRKVLIIGPSLKMGGIERASANIANFISGTGHNVTFIALFKQDHFLELNPDIKFIEPNGGLNEGKLELIKTVFWLRARIRQINPDTVLAFNYFYSAIVRLALSGTDIPCYISDRASPLFQWQRHVALFNYIIYKIFPPTGLIAQTQIAAEYKKRFFGNKTRIKVIPNALREVTLHPKINQKKQIVAVGRLNDHLKGFDRLVSAFIMIENNEWQLVFAGGDGEGTQLKQQVEKSGISDRVIFLGKVLDIDRIFAESGIFVIPSRSEGFPNALCEAMAAGLPCIAFDFVAGPGDIISDGEDGILVTDGDIKGLATKINFLINNPSERNRIGTNALKIRDRLRVDKIGKEYLDFILKDEFNN